MSCRAFRLLGVTLAFAAAATAQVSPQLRARFAHLQHGINHGPWVDAVQDGQGEIHDVFNAARAASDIALIARMGFDHVRINLDPPRLLNIDRPGVLNDAYLAGLDHTLDLLSAHSLAAVVDMHGLPEYDRRVLGDDRQLESLATSWRVLAHHLAARNPDRVFLEVLNEPVSADKYRWAGVQSKLLAAMRAGAPQLTLIATGFQWSSLKDLIFLEPVGDANVIYNFHFYEPLAFTHQGATWSSDFLPHLHGVPYPLTPETAAPLAATVQPEAARQALLRYAADRWDAAHIAEVLAPVAAWAQQHQVLVTCNEFGAFAKFAPPAARALWLHDVRTALERDGFGWTMWDYDGGFRVVTRQPDGEAVPDAAIVAALGLVGR